MDNRILIQADRIDFEGVVGLTGQDHDDYPAPGTQTRYDTMRSYLIGLLCHQSSVDAPTQYREGTLWFDLSTLTFKVRRDDAWCLLSEAISVFADTSGTLTLKDWYDYATPILAGASPEITFTGTAATAATTIAIPASLRSGLTVESRPFVYVEGLLLDPVLTELDNPNITIPSAMTIGDKFTVIIKRIPDSSFYTTPITA